MVKKRQGKKKNISKRKIIDSYLHSLYYTVKKPGSYQNAYKLYKTVVQENKHRIPLNYIKNWLHSQETFGIFKQSRTKFPRTKINPLYPGYLLDADLLSMENVQKYNNHTRFIIVLIDLFSRYAWMIPVKNKTASVIASAFDKLLKDVNKRFKPERLRTDKGGEFKNKFMKKIMEKWQIKHFFSNNEQKANYAENLIRWIKGKIYKYFHKKQTYKYIDILKDLNESYNNTYHSSIKRSPSEITKENAEKIWWELNIPKKKRKYKYQKYGSMNPKPFRYKVGDKVRVSYLKGLFKKEKDEKWSTEIYNIKSRSHRQGYPIYKIETLQNESIEGTFYEPEIQLAIMNDSDLWKIDKILKSRTIKGKKQFYVHWLGWNKSYRSWVDAKQIKDYDTIK